MNNSTSTDCQPHVSVIVPTYCEAENLPELTHRLFTTLFSANITAELIIVDDNSPDDTVETCDQLGSRYPLRLIVRHHETGLASAVMTGLQQAQGTVCVVMDADLSHPPELVPQLVSTLEQDNADFVIGSRYVKGGQVDSNWGWFRKLNSKAATWLARGLTSAKDPMAGFFAIHRRSVMATDGIRPVGYKIGLELLVRCRCRKVSEVPIQFSDRTRGTSKLTIRQQWLNLCQLLTLYASRIHYAPAFVRFALVGISGMAVDLSTFSLTQSLMPLGYARAFAIFIAMLWNYNLNRRITFSSCTATRTSWSKSIRQFAAFCAACSLAALTNWLVSTSASGSLWPGQTPLLKATCGILTGAIVNYALCVKIVFDGVRRPNKSRQAALPATVPQNRCI
jgi:dolichol-phosphate mannosyltransferase